MSIEIPKELRDYINKTPEFSSYLYDIDLLPEQLTSEKQAYLLGGCYLMYKRIKDDGQGS